ncbi:class I SAM-dependent methyltransferase [Streptosporangium sp. NPDC006013]|uniref:class I SAM-dependent methyltransferase n=1 Tax=Streptosporangium sp. NPDC006013 TaxID=3155596 RepID=UPI0033BAB62F
MDDHSWNPKFVAQYLRKYLPHQGPDISRKEALAAISLTAHTGSVDVLDAPCGFGRHALALAAEGHRVQGVDASPAMIEKAAAQTAREQPRWLVADYRDIPLPDATFDVVINLFTSMGFCGDEGDTRALSEFHRLLRPGGSLVIETAHRDQFAGRPSHSTRWRQFPNDGYLLESREFELTTGWLRTEHLYLNGGTAESHVSRIRIYAVTEITKMLTQAGFKNVDRYGGFDRSPFTADRRLVVLAKK